MTMPGAWCLVLVWCCRQDCNVQRGSLLVVQLRCVCVWTVDRMPHEPGSPELQCAPAVIDSAKSGKQHGTAVARRQWALAICRDGTRTRATTVRTSGLRRYFGSSPSHRGGRAGPALGAYSTPFGGYHVTEQCLTSGCARPGRGPSPALIRMQASPHPHSSRPPPSTTTTICDRSQSALHTATVAGLILPRV